MNRNIPAGPLLTNHLHNLDLELELLKRKREILEQQQMLASGSQSFQGQRSFDYDQPQTTYGHQQYNPSQQYNQNRNFSHLYGQGSGSSSDRNQFDRKRQAGRFQDDPPAKRFSGPQKAKPRKAYDQGPRAQFNAGHVHQPFAGQQAYKANQHHQPFLNQVQPFVSATAKTFAKPKQNPFKPNHKYSKPKSKPIPNSIAERKAIINKETNRALDYVDDSPPFVLKPGDVPSKIFGRLELGLGQVLKEIRDKYESVEEYSICFRSPYLKRVMKSALRERIKEVMMGKAVTNGQAILDAYREKYPLEADVTIVKLAIQARDESKNALNLVHSEDPIEFYNVNIHKLINMRLDDIFTKVHKMYEDEVAVPTTAYNISEEEYAKIAKDTEDKGESSSANGTAEITKDTEDKGESSSAYGTVKTTKDTEEGDNLSANGTVDTNTETTLADKTAHESTADTNNKESDKGKEVKTSEVDITKEKDVKLKEGETSNKGDASKKFDIKNIGEWVDKQLKEKLPQVLPNYRQHLFKILEADRTYKAGRAIILAAARSMASRTGVNTHMVKDGPSERTNDMPYFAKVVGRPSLPKKPIMRKFLDQFQPSSIKKHKSVHNLLFIGFKNKENLDAILAAHGTSVGNCVISVKVSEKATQSSENQQTNDNDVIIIEDRKGDTEKTTDDSIEINDDMTNQIDELLCSIRKSEEDQDETKNVNSENKTDGTKPSETKVKENNTEETDAEESKAEETKADEKNETETDVATKE